MARKATPPKLKQQIMYESQFVCVICQREGFQIHHIDQDNSNNAEENLVCLCLSHHGEAHTARDLSQNLNPDALRHAKKSWNDTVKTRREDTASVSGQLALSGDSPLAGLGVTWGYINHQRVIQMVSLESLSDSDKQLLSLCINRGIVDQSGILIKPAGISLASNYIGNSVYDWYEHGDDQRLHKLYVSFVDQVSRTVNSIHLERTWWSKARCRELVQPGSFLFVEKDFYFKTVSDTKENEQRRVHTTKGKVRIEFFVDTKNMFGSTSMTVSFCGHQSCGAFLQLKSLDESDEGLLTLRCTPIALGVAFNKIWS